MQLKGFANHSALCKHLLHHLNLNFNNGVQFGWMMNWSSLLTSFLLLESPGTSNPASCRGLGSSNPTIRTTGRGNTCTELVRGEFGLRLFSSLLGDRPIVERFGKLTQTLQSELLVEVGKFLKKVTKY